MIAPFTISERAGGASGASSLTGLGWAMKSPWTSAVLVTRSLLLVILVVLALAYLVFFRDALLNGKKTAAAKPKP